MDTTDLGVPSMTSSLLLILATKWRFFFWAGLSTSRATWSALARGRSPAGYPGCRSSTLDLGPPSRSRGYCKAEQRRIDAARGMQRTYGTQDGSLDEIYSNGFYGTS
ncbi:hypothetical protein AB5N19_01527 [Seiridium cardinale]|uniref:Uncharacterized protein n=1 Tax=Seiridium cardinale TaxID=138064 RepID=A0ABR2XWQ6_9PEZI